MTTETQMVQSVTITLGDGSKATFTGPAILFEGQTKKIVDVSFGKPFEMPDGCSWGTLEVASNPDPGLEVRTVSRPGAVLEVKAVPIPPKIQSKMAEAIKGEK